MSPLAVRGKFTAKLSTPSKTTVQPVYVVADLTGGLLSRSACVALGLVARVEAVPLTSVEAVKLQFPKLFSGLGRMEGEYKIELKADAKPFALSTPRRVPLPLLPKVKRELARMEELGVISRVEQPTDWCAGMVPVPKPNRDEVRVCVDLTKLNKSVKRERHMVPSVEHTLGQLAGAKVFSKLDANSGFWQIPLSKQSALLTTFITPFGRYCFKRLCFGISSAPEHFQKRMSQLLEGLDGVVCQMDDILVYADTQTQHDKRLVAVLERLTKAGVTLKSEKCEFAKTSIKLLGQILDTTGVKADLEKVKAVSNMEAPTDVGGVRRFLGMVNHLGKYLPHLAEKTQPLRELLSTKNMWCWSEAQQTVFDNIKAELSKPPNLALYNPKSQTTVSADASSYGLGAVLLQKQEDDTTKPVAFASRALTPTEQRYAQIEKEALAITWACERFSDFLIGIEFHVETDHKPLVPLLGSNNLDELSPRVQRLRMRLMRYSFTISHVPGKHIATAGVLSRAPERMVCDETLGAEIDLYAHQVISGLPAIEKRLQEIREQQDKHETLKQIKLYCKNGWPDKLKIPGPCFPYHQHAGDLTVENDPLLKGMRIVIPKRLQKDVLTRLHTGQQGIVKSRERAKQSVWWPELSSQLQQLVADCETCAKVRQQPRETLMPTEFPTRPWELVGADLFEWSNSQYLVAVDYYSQYIEIAKLSSTTSAAVIDHLKSIFARHGIQTELRSDNGPQFSSEHFQKRFPQSNGEAERAVRTVKSLLQKEGDRYLALMAYRATPLANGYSPAELLMGRKLRTTVPILPSCLNPGWTDKAKLREREGKEREKQWIWLNNRHRAQDLTGLHPGDHVWITDMKTNGTISGRADTPRSYLVETPKGRLRRNRSHLITLKGTKTEPNEQQVPVLPENSSSPVSNQVQQSLIPPCDQTTERRYPTRERDPPRYLKDLDLGRRYPRAPE
uniref:Gypsy retrotransposon integrase-like protein 1 n=1 Tax=Nothobranchius furzeri TaxID=105023 RepID=A0A8C6M7K5_NOTFU